MPIPSEDLQTIARILAAGYLRLRYPGRGRSPLDTPEKSSPHVHEVDAAGNNSSTAPSYPAACNNAIAVAATDGNNALASFSNYGSWIDLSAPGTIPRGERTAALTRTECSLLEVMIRRVGCVVPRHAPPADVC